MTRDDIIKLARQAGYGDAMVDLHAPALERFAHLVAANERLHGMKLLTDVLIDAAVAAEREACAKVCESLKPTMRAYDHRFWDACHESAAAIRSRT